MNLFYTTKDDKLRTTVFTNTCLKLCRVIFLRLHVKNPTSLRLIISLLFSLGISQLIFSQSQTFTSSNSFSVPSGVTAVKVECWGGGGAGGGNAVNRSRGGGGGAGGSYVSDIISVTSGNVYTVTVGGTTAGTRGDGAKGQPSWFGSTSTIYAEGGNGGSSANNSTVLGGVGSTSLSIGGTKFAGGNGASGTTSRSGGGGGGAGSDGAGGNANGTTAGTGTTVGGGNGGAGSTTERDGNAGANYGGGGAGAYIPDNTDHVGGTGAAGRVIVSWITVSGTSTETCIGGNTGTITVTPSGGNAPYTYTLNGGTAQSSNVFGSLAAGSYAIVATDSQGRKATTTVTVSSPVASIDNQNLAGTNSWIGHVYDGINFDTYYGSYNETETFNQDFGGATNCFVITSNSISRSIYTETFSVKYRMNSTKKGLYVANLGSDDGSRLTVDGTDVYINWNDQAYSSKPRVLFSLTGNSSLLYEFYENGGANQAVFENFTQVIANNLTNNTTQNIDLNSTGSAISGDIYGTLPAGISLSGTGYQWTYSTTPTGARTAISGATGATYIPNTSTAPFNVPGTYYIFRNAVLSSSNNISPNPYIATNESNYATLTVNTPTITTSLSALTAFSYIFGNGPSGQKTFTVSGSHLGGNIIVTPTTDYEISTTSGSGFQSTPITLTRTGGTVATTTIYVRLKSGLAAGDYNSQNITVTSASATTKTVTCSGTVYSPTITSSLSTLTGFSYPVGSGPSAQQSFTVSGVYLSANIVVTPPTNYEISTTSGSGFQSTPITLVQTGGNVAITTIYVRLKAGLPAASYNTEIISLASTGASSKTVSCSGSVGNPTLNVSATTLSEFTYSYGAGPSAEQSFTATGTYLSSNVTVTPSTNFEISVTSGSGFQSTPITLTQTNGNVNQIIYVRLKAGLAVGSYSSGNIALTASGVTAKNVSISGSVYPAYCTSSGNTQYNTGITLVSLNTINNTSAKPAGYTSYLNQVTNLNSGTSYNLIVNINTDGNYRIYAMAWIDWNHDGDFDDANETFNLGSAVNTANGPTSSSPLSISVPATALSGNTRMRISAKYNSASTACETNFDGEVEDYTVNVVLPTITTGAINGSPFAPNSSVSVPFTIAGGGFNSGNVFTAQLSNSTGSFASPVNIGSLTSTSAGTISATIPANAISGTGYRIRVISNNPSIIGSSNATNISIIAPPSISTSTNTLNGFSYPVGYGPSTTQSFTVSGSSLLGNITITPASNFEISTTDSPSFVASSLITLPVVSGNVSSTPIYVRMKAGLALGTYSNDSIVAISSGATTKKISCNGDVIIAPAISTSTISGTFNYVFGSGPSTEKTFTISGTNLTGDITVTPPTDYEISRTSGSGFVSTPITLTRSGSSVSTTTIYVRLRIGLGVGTYAENIVVSSSDATSKNVSLSGSITSSATIYNAISFLSGFTYAVNNGPSGIQSFVVKASALTADVTVTPPTNFEISKDGTTFYSTNLTLNRVGSILTTDTIVYVRMKSGLAVGTYGPLSSSIVLTSNGAITKSVACTGQVVNTGVRTILVSKNTLTGFGYEYSYGPSTPQSFTVSAAELTANLVLTAPTNYEISQNPNSGYSATITLTGTRINPTLIYVRLKAGLNAGNYGTLASPSLLRVTSTGATTVNISSVGKVFSSPLISASGGGSFCAGETINFSSSGDDIQSRYWTGPNGFYSSATSPVLTTNATTSLTGTYTVNGSVQVGGNLITNGDFEAGNTSFSSGYGYVAPTAGALNPEGLYSITYLPRDVHNDFTTQPDHTTGSGLQMVVNGSPTAGVVVWSQSVPVIPGATYQFTYSEQTVNISQNPKNASQLQLYVNGVAAGPVYTAPQVNYQWATFLYNASAGSNTVLNLELINQNTIAAGNDFALDDIVFQQILPASATVGVTVNPILPVSVSISASPGTSVYSNTPVTFTATPTNGGTSPTYVWKVNGDSVGIGKNYTYTPEDGDVVSCTLTSSLSCVSNNPATASLNMTVTFRENYWMGYIDTDWGKAENWTANYVPLTGEDVEYATVANFGTSAMRDLQLDMNRTIGSLINATTKRLLIPASKGLTVNNTITTDGNPDRILIYASTTLANGSLIFHNLENQPVSATVEMYSKASWNLSAPVNNKYKWQYFGSPLRSVKAYPTFIGSYVRKWYETGTTIQNHWIQLENDSSIYPFYGYEICQESPKTLTFKGQLVNSNFNSGQLAITPTALYPGQHIFANPYTAAIDIKQLQFGDSIESSVYLYNTGTYSIWDINGQGTTRTTSDEGQYIVVPKETAGSLGLPRQIPSMQAMLVKALGYSNAYLNINYSSVVMNNSDLQRVKSTSETKDKICTKIDLIGEKSSDQIWLFTDSTCTKNFDNGWDGSKLIGGSLNPQLFAVEQDGYYQVDAVDDINNTVLGFQAGTDIEYSLKFTHQNITRQYQSIYLWDIVENRVVDITQSGSVYNFNAVSTSKPVNRFQIMTISNEIDAPDNDSQINIFNSRKTIFIHNESNVDGELMIYDIFGRYLLNKPFIANGVTTIPTDYISGGYIVKVKTINEEYSKRIIIR